MIVSDQLPQSLGGWDRLLALRDAFRAELPSQRQSLHAAVAAGDWDTVRRLAHALRSDLLVFERVKLADLTHGLEVCALCGREQRARQLWARLEPQLERLVVDLGELEQRPPSPSAGEAGRRSAATPIASARRRRVLLIEDVELLRRLLCKLLELRGHEVVPCADGEAALARLSEGDIDVVLTDMQLPGISGYETIARIRAGESPERRIWVIATTGSSCAGEECLEAGADRFLSKPIDQRALWSAVEAAPARA